ncbi:mannan endo-1,4-beta-mannosidase [Alteromonadaceae bacterium 2753L.S.0a.02]|nr:mannan endo-1,4-beta-mannosidase [Alteromonadaceae bacterium 2753L.S.0a.02]
MRRLGLGVSALLFTLVACSPPPEMLEKGKPEVIKNPLYEFKQVPASEFVQVYGNKFYLQGKPYRFAGANVWYAAYLGSDQGDVGNRQRLRKELDLLQQTGVTNLRILGASEQSPLKNSLRPAISEKAKILREDLLVGLDFVLAEMAQRNMKAVIYLNNFWEWSGGMMTYLSWVNGGEFINLGDENHPWPAFALATAEFYSNPSAIELYNIYIKQLITRTNTVTGKPYVEDPTIMAWQLANEPRPGDGEQSKVNLPAYFDWIRNTAQLIKSLDKKHLVSVGSEGTKGCLEFAECFLGAHSGNGIDYATFHIWPKNWGWYNSKNPQETFGETMRKTDAYITEHITLAEQLQIPLVLEEFGLERDLGQLNPDAPVSFRNNYLQYVYSRVVGSAMTGGSLVGSNIWSWGGFGAAQHDDYNWQSGDKSYVGDPPQEPQGLNSVFASDAETLSIFASHSRTLQN